MKRLLTVWLAILMLLTLTACGGGQSPKGSSEADGAKAENVDMKNQENEGDLGDYHVEIIGFETTQDYENKDVLVLRYAFTNNGEDTECADVAIYIKAFQNGIELDHAYVDSENANNGMKDIRPGTTISVDEAFLLTDTSDVEFEITELISFSDDMVVATYTFDAE